VILKCQVVTVTRNRKGQPIRSATVVSGDPITLGRGSEATVHLPDPRVHLRHAIIRNDDVGKLFVEGQEADVDVNGELRGRAKLRRGDRILIGPYQILPEPATGPDHDFTLAIELVQPFPAGLADLRARSGTSLSTTWLSKRALSWGLFGLTACLALGFPLAFATSPSFKESASRLPVALRPVVSDAVWNPGPLSSGHQNLSHRCQACHQEAFERVPDRACVECHRATGGHVSAASAQAGITLATPCVECHRDHKGERAVHTDSTPCATCHGDIRRLYPTTRLIAASDFANDHAGFSLAVLNARSGVTERVAPDQLSSYRETSGLKFPHATHLAPKGVRSPQGLRILECGSCHRLDSGGRRYEPVTMTGQCSECHRLEFEPAVTSRQVPHGDPALILTGLREFYSRIALGDRPIDVTVVNGLLRPPGVSPGGAEQRSARQWAEDKARSVAVGLIEKRVCVQCHEVGRSGRSAGGEPGWTIQPVRMTTRWLPNSAFDHTAHKSSPCEKCHDVRSSRQSGDMAMPTIADCRSCHGGTQAVAGRVWSPCERCHSFHLQPKTPASEQAGTVAQTAGTGATP